MAISSETTEVRYTANGATTVFAYTFKVFDQTHLEVIVTDTSGTSTTQTITTHYTVSGVGETSGGNVTFVTAPTDQYTVTIRRAVPLTQTFDVRNQGVFYPEGHENALDRTVMQIQQLDARVDASLKLPVNETPSTAKVTLPSSTSRASKAFIWDASGNPSAGTLTSVGAPLDAAYVTIGAAGDLSAERALTGTSNQITVTDNGANSTVVLSTPQNIHSAATPTFAGLTLSTSGLTLTLGNATLTDGDLTLSSGVASITDSHATTTPQASLIQASTGDAGIRLALGSSRSYILAIDNSDSDILKISTAASGSAVAGTGDLIEIDTSGNIEIAGTVQTNAATGYKTVASVNGDAQPVDFSYTDSGASISGRMEVIQAAVATTDATATNVTTIGATGNADDTIAVEAHVVGRRTGGSAGTAGDSSYHVLRALFRANSAGTAMTQIGSTSQSVIAESQAGWDATLDASGSDARVRVTGAADNNVSWYATVYIHSVEI